VIRLQGFAVVEAQGLLQSLARSRRQIARRQRATSQPRGSRAKRANADNGDANLGNGGGQVVTQIFRLNHEQANNLLPVLRPLISPNNTINVNPGNNSLVITDYADNLQRMARIIASLRCLQRGRSRSDHPQKCHRHRFSAFGFAFD
jgi:general secretion pathway protein D